MDGITDLVLEIIGEHEGETNAIKSRDIAYECKISGIIVRKAVNELRILGFPICSGVNGYWYAKDVKEVNKTVENLRARIRGISRAIEGLEWYASCETDY